MDNLLKCHTYVFCLQPPTLTRSIKCLQTYASYFRDATLVQCVKQIDIYKSPVSPVILCALCG
jgi:hypothetical protein